MIRSVGLEGPRLERQRVHRSAEQTFERCIDHTVLLDERLAGELRSFDHSLEMVGPLKRTDLNTRSRESLLQPILDFIDTDSLHDAEKPPFRHVSTPFRGRRSL